MSDRRLQASRDDRRRDRDGEPRSGGGDPRGDRGGDRRDRRRSRSPGGGGGSRRYERREEVDNYSSSRGYREREREDRYGGRDRGGGDREWGRDRGGDRRDGRRGDDRRRERGDDLFSDRRRPRDDRGDRGDRRDDRDRDHRRDRDDERQLERQARKSASPAPRKPREPTPDLTDVVPILERKRRLTQWDIKPAGYENITAEQAKLSGMYPLPGAPRAQQPMDPQRLQAFMNQPGNQASSTALKPSTARQSKRLMVYNLPESATDSGLAEFFNLQLNGLNITRGNDPCVSALVNKDRSFAMLEFKTPEDATTAMTMLNGVNMNAASMELNGHSNGTSKGFDIQRPKDYIVPTAPEEGDGERDTISSTVPDSQNKLALTNLPVNLDEPQILELLQSFGPLKNFILVSYSGEEVSRGLAFLEYRNAEHTNVAVEALNGMDLGSLPLKIFRPCVGITQVSGEMSVNAMSMMASTKSEDVGAGRVLCLMNMITPAELMDAEEADEILEDITEECAKFGKLLDVKMPRPAGGARQGNGVGKIYLKYETPESAAKALAALAGRNFSGRTVVVTHFGEEYFDLGAW